MLLRHHVFMLFSPICFTLWKRCREDYAKDMLMIAAPWYFYYYIFAAPRFSLLLLPLMIYDIFIFDMIYDIIYEHIIYYFRPWYKRCHFHAAEHDIYERYMMLCAFYIFDITLFPRLPPPCHAAIITRPAAFAASLLF